MTENIIVGIIVLAAGAFTLYRLFLRPKCGCGSECGCPQSGAGSFGKAENGCCGGKDGSCRCGK